MANVDERVFNRVIAIAESPMCRMAAEDLDHDEVLNDPLYSGASPKVNTTK